jgi:hypothetical protein
MAIRGSCHCGRITYRLDAEPTEAIECNCSICRRKGSLLAAFAPDQFHLETSRDDIAHLHLRQARHPPSVLQDLRLRAFFRGNRPRWRGDGGDQSSLRREPRPFDAQDRSVRRSQSVGLRREGGCDDLEGEAMRSSLRSLENGSTERSRLVRPT